jgi:hypothetical protein
MKECYGNYMSYPICQGHNDCNEKGCFSRTSIDKGACKCPYKGSCHIPRQYIQEKIRQEHSGRTIEDCDFYKLLKPMYEERKEEG